MSTNAEDVLRAYTALPPPDRMAVFEAIARSQLPEACDALTDEELTAIAAQSFALLDEEESRAEAQ